MIADAKTMIHDRSHRFSDGHSSLYAVIKGSVSDSGVTRPLRDAFGLALVRQKSSAARVVGLFSRGSPSAVARAVAALIVDSFYRVKAGWARSQIRIEILERDCPSLAHSNAANAVAVIARMKLIVASLNHSDPHLVFRRLGHAVSGICAHDVNPRPAPARTRVAADQVAGAYNGLSPALTLATPLDSPC